MRMNNNAKIILLISDNAAAVMCELLTTRASLSLVTLIAIIVLFLHVLTCLNK